MATGESTSDSELDNVGYQSANTRIVDNGSGASTESEGWDTFHQAKSRHDFDGLPTSSGHPRPNELVPVLDEKSVKIKFQTWKSTIGSRYVIQEQMQGQVSEVADHSQSQIRLSSLELSEIDGSVETSSDNSDTVQFKTGNTPVRSPEQLDDTEPYLENSNVVQFKTDREPIDSSEVLDETIPYEETLEDIPNAAGYLPKYTPVRNLGGPSTSTPFKPDHTDQTEESVRAEGEQKPTGKEKSHSSKNYNFSPEV